MKLREGEIFGLVGINGAGKSTLLRTLTNVYTQEKGTILFDGIDTLKDENKRREIFFLGDDFYYPRYTSVKNFLNFYKVFYQFDDKNFNRIIQKLNLDLSKNISNYSKGMKRQLFIALALSLEVNYLFLDEAFDGLDPLARLIFKEELIKKHEDHPKLTTIITSHNLKELEDITSTYAIIDKGEIISSGFISDEKRNICKYQIVFSTLKSRDDFLDFDVIDYHQEGRVIQIIIKGNQEKILKDLESMNPILLEQLELDFEEFFIAESKERGYLK